MNKYDAINAYESLKLSYSSIAYAIVPFIMYASLRAISSYKLYTSLKPNSNKKVLSRPVIEKLIDEIEYKEDKLKEYVDNFINVIVNNFDDKDLTNFKNNIQTVQIEKVKFESKSIIEEYSTFQNTIFYLDEDMLNAIYHELFHLASSVINGSNAYSGFSMYSPKEKVDIGMGLNEGFTQLLTTRFFKDIPKAYMFEMNIALLLEYIVGDKNMASMYLNADLNSLIDYLSKYAKREEIIYFLTCLDFILECETSRKTNLFPKGKILDSMTYVIDFLIRVFAFKISDEFNKKEIDKEALAKYISSFCSYIPFEVKVKGKVYEVYNAEKVSNMILNNLKISGCKVVISNGESPSR